jgi:hypothetical protein
MNGAGFGMIGKASLALRTEFHLFAYVADLHYGLHSPPNFRKQPTSLHFIARLEAPCP